MAYYANGCPHVKCLIGINSTVGRAHVIPLRCKRWSCRYCARINLRILLDRIRRGRPNKLITLTAQYDPSISPEAIYKSHRPAIRRLVEFCRRRYGSFESCTITELHKSGYPHWHLVTRSGFIPQAVLSAEWERLTGSKIVDIRRIHSDRHAANYVAKYVTKTAGKNKPDWLKRVAQFSRNYAERRKWLKPAGYDYFQTNESPSAVFDHLDKFSWFTVRAEVGFISIPIHDQELPELIERFAPRRLGCPP